MRTRRSGSHRALRRTALAAGTAAAVAIAVRTTRPQAPVATLDEIDSGTLPEGRHLQLTTPDGAELAVTVAGPDDGPTVVLPHCWTGSRAVWGPVAHRLVASGRRVVLYDQRGHGESTTGAEPLSIPLLGHDLRTVLDAVGVEEAVIAGHSMGGMTIQSYAREHPEDFAGRVRGVVLVATAARVLGRALPATAVERLLGERPTPLTSNGRIGRLVVRGSLGPGAHPRHVELTLRGWVETSPAARAGFLTAMSGMDLRDCLPEIGVPAALLVGTRDTLTPPRLARQLAAAIPDAELTVLPGRGHMLPLEAPDAIVDAITGVEARATATPSASPAAIAEVGS